MYTNQLFQETPSRSLPIDWPAPPELARSLSTPGAMNPRLGNSSSVNLGAKLSQFGQPNYMSYYPGYQDQMYQGHQDHLYTGGYVDSSMTNVYDEGSNSYGAYGVHAGETDSYSNTNTPSVNAKVTNVNANADSMGFPANAAAYSHSNNNADTSLDEYMYRDQIQFIEAQMVLDDESFSEAHDSPLTQVLQGSPLTQPLPLTQSLPAFHSSIHLSPIVSIYIDDQKVYHVVDLVLTSMGLGPFLHHAQPVPETFLQMLFAPLTASKHPLYVYLNGLDKYDGTVNGKQRRDMPPVAWLMSIIHQQPSVPSVQIGPEKASVLAKFSWCTQFGGEDFVSKFYDATAGVEALMFIGMCLILIKQISDVFMSAGDDTGCGLGEISSGVTFSTFSGASYGKTASALNSASSDVTASALNSTSSGLGLSSNLGTPISGFMQTSGMETPPIVNSGLNRVAGLSARPFEVSQLLLKPDIFTDPTFMSSSETLNYGAPPGIFPQGPRFNSASEPPADRTGNSSIWTNAAPMDNSPQSTWSPFGIEKARKISLVDTPSPSPTPSNVWDLPDLDTEKVAVPKAGSRTEAKAARAVEAKVKETKAEMSPDGIRGSYPKGVISASNRSASVANKKTALEPAKIPLPLVSEPKRVILKRGDSIPPADIAKFPSLSESMPDKGKKVLRRGSPLPVPENGVTPTAIKPALIPVTRPLSLPKTMVKSGSEAFKTLLSEINENFTALLETTYHAPVVAEEIAPEVAVKVLADDKKVKVKKAKPVSAKKDKLKAVVIPKDREIVPLPVKAKPDLEKLLEKKEEPEAKIPSSVPVTSSIPVSGTGPVNSSAVEKALKKFVPARTSDVTSLMPEDFPKDLVSSKPISGQNRVQEKVQKEAPEVETQKKPAKETVKVAPVKAVPVKPESGVADAVPNAVDDAVEEALYQKLIADMKKDVALLETQAARIAEEKATDEAETGPQPETGTSDSAAPKAFEVTETGPSSPKAAEEQVSPTSSPAILVGKPVTPIGSIITEPKPTVKPAKTEPTSAPVATPSMSPVVGVPPTVAASAKSMAPKSDYFLLHEEIKLNIQQLRCEFKDTESAHLQFVHTDLVIEEESGNMALEKPVYGSYTAKHKADPTQTKRIAPEETSEAPPKAQAPKPVQASSLADTKTPEKMEKLRYFW
ncbi:hypothetical protein BABINDRAFT_166779 [Babjeviella inositovora NRRL Y-12698]|uniref:Uncharacterized protein n=1 Tax=Babjeviella inositovora NRRL Y-12698 TaxID=984486 RepID=A0A1E3QS36_9ASCO|nr:uncharacterized protein BABINDRAFT_166779 [Babjeviella inositovora NRRL Y-12698]ODQ80448.1 hypothetical protein BABINDRAFT_166779 [Babjeviella inositovora NRRL Y-12698]